MPEPLTLQLASFEGPLDLLLHLIRQQRLDIYDIPIAQVTDQYMHYLRQMEQMNLQIAGDYFVMASTLLKIKSQQLLPHNEYVDNTEEDSRQELVEQLVEYSMYQKIASYLGQQAKKAPFVAAKDPAQPTDQAHLPLKPGQITTRELVQAMSKVVARLRLRQPATSQVKPHHFKITELRGKLVQMLARKGKVSFTGAAEDFSSMDEVVGLFLAVLGLYKDQAIAVIQRGDDLLLQSATPTDD
ncbi:MAG: segregation/condensation protein A [Lactobacillus sp.]|jgi:segregation and condensation protein A|nr:segregation/condensation protein A [Lactobacillus sp.]MCH4069277.1 segregation/condensation protein A [Lactobacillus sp.]MCI1303579.1 segregation/condensation protein A [Lactobacillus sp.]MCI1329755.1 segregation/condensation protein A [Lactobacillus sp.]MCI1359288.1 segregation/condensation protein A [Lactobacillus sp.]